MPNYLHTPAVDLGFDSLPCYSAQSSLVGQWGHGFLTATRQPALRVRHRVSMTRSSGGRILKQTLPVASMNRPFVLVLVLDWPTCFRGRGRGRSGSWSQSTPKM